MYGRTVKRKKLAKDIPVTVNRRALEDDESRPHVFYFPSGPPPGTGEPEGGEDGFVVQCFQNPTPGKGNQRVYVAQEGEEVEYVGANFKGEDTGFVPCNFAVGLYSHATGALQLLPLASERLVRLEQRIEGLDYGDEEAQAAEEEEGGGREEVEEEEAPAVQYAAGKGLLDEFGNRKQRSQREARDRGQESQRVVAGLGAVNNLTVAGMDGHGGMVATTEAMERTQEAASRNIPPNNPTALSAPDAYPVHWLISAQEWSAIDVKPLITLAKKARKGVNVKEEGGEGKDEEGEERRPKYPDWVLNRLHFLDIEDKESRDRRARLLEYISLLLRFHALPSHQLTAEAERPDDLESWFKGADEAVKIPRLMFEKFCNTFSEKVDDKKGCLRFNRQRHHMDLLISYVLVLGLTIDMYVTNPMEFGKELQFSVSNMRTRYRELGCKVVRLPASDDYQAVLQTPLVFPEMGKKRGK